MRVLPAGLVPKIRFFRVSVVLGCLFLNQEMAIFPKPPLRKDLGMSRRFAQYIRNPLINAFATDFSGSSNRRVNFWWNL